ncbi:MAG: hypothetical protein CMG69_00940 [Candidatus Marinimicrobia bacterium]|nr:hypothetical protein [Candidatus Neomarinimicrobiota bacterium]|tara:strand:- start:20127 stop:20897 length:771 start_codon:yes stop_codon:yes gene_type:complete
MLITKLIKPAHPLHKALASKFKHLKVVENFNVVSWFAPWSMLAAGEASKMGLNNRYSFWEFSQWQNGIISIIIISLFIILLKTKEYPITLNKSNFNKPKEWVILISFYFLCWIFGWGYNNLTYGVLYFLCYLPISIGISLPYLISQDKTPDYISRKTIGIISSILFLVSCIFGWLIDDPVLATASIVIFPFSVVLSVTSHVRHLQRTHIFPLFILMGFVTSRVGWFLFPVLVLFYFLRIYNYFVYKKVSPTFAVDH